MLYSALMLVILIASVSIPLITKLDDSWGEWKDHRNRPIFPDKGNNPSCLIKLLAAILLLACLTVSIIVVGHWTESKPKDQATLFFVPFLALPSLLLLSPKSFAEAYLIPACKWMFLIYLFLFVLVGYSSLYDGISEHYLTVKNGGKVYLEKDAGEFWFRYVSYAILNGLFLCILKYSFLWLFKKLKR